MKEYLYYIELYNPLDDITICQSKDFESYLDAQEFYNQLELFDKRMVKTLSAYVYDEKGHYLKTEQFKSEGGRD